MTRRLISKPSPVVARTLTTAAGFKSTGENSVPTTRSLAQADDDDYMDLVNAKRIVKLRRDREQYICKDMTYWFPFPDGENRHKDYFCEVDAIKNEPTLNYGRRFYWADGECLTAKYEYKFLRSIWDFLLLPVNEKEYLDSMDFVVDVENVRHEVFYEQEHYMFLPHTDSDHTAEEVSPDDSVLHLGDSPVKVSRFFCEFGAGKGATQENSRLFV